MLQGLYTNLQIPVQSEFVVLQFDLARLRIVLDKNAEEVRGDKQQYQHELKSLS